MSQIELEIISKTKDLGDNFVVRRALPSIKKPMVGPFIFWDHMGPSTLVGDKTLTVRAHPHIGIATITYLFTGEIMHRDSLGNEQAIRPGEVNWMTAGKGIAHSERAQAWDNGEAMTLEGIQLWVALPKEHEDVDPSFVHIKEKELPIIDKNDIWLRLIAGRFQGKESPIPTYSQLFYLNGKAKMGRKFHHELASDEEGAVYIVKGGLEIEGNTYERYSLVSFRKGSSISFKSISNSSEFMVFGGQSFPEKRHIWWNYVSSSQEKIEQAKLDWKAGNFPKVINENEWIPLPES